MQRKKISPKKSSVNSLSALLKYLLIFQIHPVFTRKSCFKIIVDLELIDQNQIKSYFSIKGLKLITRLIIPYNKILCTPHSTNIPDPKPLTSPHNGMGHVPKSLKRAKEYFPPKISFKIVLFLSF